MFRVGLTKIFLALVLILYFFALSQTLPTGQENSVTKKAVVEDSTPTTSPPSINPKNEIVRTETKKTEVAEELKKIPIRQQSQSANNIVIKPQPATTAAKTETPAISEPATSTLPNFEDINTVARNIVINLLCTTKQGGYFEPMSGSGVIIDRRGIILTNAHVGQYFLLKDYPVKDNIDCAVRTGSPAEPKYRAELIFLSPRWIEKNYVKIKQENPTGSGEEDFALLKITAGVSSGVTLPNEFPFLPIDVDSEYIKTKKELLLIGYPASFLGGILTQMSLNMISTFGHLKDIYTFDENTPDLIEVDGSLLAQQGSSGGAIVGGNSEVLGIIATASESGNLDSRILRAITTSYINRRFKDQVGFGLLNPTDQQLEVLAEKFKSTLAPVLRKILVDELMKT